MPAETPASSIEQTYREVMLGPNPPKLGLISGAALNAHFRTRDYAPAEWYLVTPQGIFRVS